jgi:hypothetical protein
MMETQDSKFDVIQRPPKIYLDTNYLINIAKIRKGEKLQEGQSEGEYNCLDGFIRSYCGLIFNLAALLEWVEGGATVESAREITAVVDSANLKYFFEADYLVYTREVLDQCHEQNPDIQVPDFPIFQNLSNNSTLCSARGILANQVPDYLEEDEFGQLEKKEGTPTEVEIGSIQQWVEETINWRRRNPETYQERIAGFKAPLSEDIARKDEYFHDRKRYRRDWIKRLLKIDKILRAFNPGIDVNAILEKIDIEDCPAITLYWTVREKRMRSGLPPNDNDVDDYMYIPVIPYADVVLIEKQLRAFVLQADKSLESKVFSKVGDTLNALENQGFTW